MFSSKRDREPVLFLCEKKNRKESEVMKKMNYAEAIIDGYNAITGAIVAVLSYILGEHWFLFVAFLGRK